MAQAQLYIYDGVDKWIPATAADLGGGSTAPTDPSTGANQVLAIASLQALDLDNATEQEQVAIRNAIDAMTLALQNDDNATETKQDAIIAKNEAIRLLNTEISGKITNNISQIASFNSKLGFSVASPLESAIASLNTLSDQIRNRLGDDAISSALPDVRSLLKSLLDAQNSSSAVGVLKTPIAGNAGDAVSEAIAVDTDRVKTKITNLSKTDYLYFCFGFDASLTNSSVLLPLQTYETETSVEAQAKLSVVTEAGKTVNYSLQATDRS